MRRETINKPRTKSPEQALEALMRQCARAEKSSGDALRLMSRWGVAQDCRAGILERLIKDKFIDDSRFAAAFVREKLNLSGWGERKIATTLKMKGISGEIIAEALSDLDAEQMEERLLSKVERKARTLKSRDRYDLKSKLIRYALSLGYSYDMVMDVVDKIVIEKEEDDEL